MKALIKKHVPQPPAETLANELMIFYAPRVLYEKQATIMEMICASVYLTTMIAFTLEKKLRHQQTRLFDTSRVIRVVQIYVVF